MGEKKDIKICLLDCGGVIYPYSLTPFYEYLKNNGVYKHTFKFKWKELMQGMITTSFFYQDVCQKCGMSYDKKREDELDRVLLLGVENVNLETQEIVRYLRGQNIKIGLLSNAIPQLEGSIKEIFFDEGFVFPSYHLKALKPDVEIFKKVQEQTKIPFEQMLFIDDKKENVDAANQLGITGVVYNQKTILMDVKRVLGENNVRYSCNWRCNCR